MHNNLLTIFYDGRCPLCSLEMEKLKRQDRYNKINLENLHQEDFAEHFPDIDFNQAMKVLHAKYQGKILRGLEVTHRAWTIVGKGVYVAPLKFPVIKQIANLSYKVLAKYRHPISNCLYSRFGIGNKPCEEGVCYDKKSDYSYRSK